MHRHPIARFTPENYARFHQVVLDTRGFPLSYDEFNERAKREERDSNRRGNLPVYVDIDPDAFLAWCEEIGTEPNMDSLKGYLARKAAPSLYKPRR